jgi:hypothetical protein
MAEVTATGPVSLSLERLRTLLAASSSWQTWTATASASAAKAHVYLIAPPEASGREGFTLAALQALRPYARIDIVRDGNAIDVQRHADSPPFTWTYGGTLVLTFEDDVAAGLIENLRDADITFLNRVGAVIDDMLALSGTTATGVDGGYLRLTAASLIRCDRAREETETEQGEFHEAEIRISWGVF